MIYGYTRTSYLNDSTETSLDAQRRRCSGIAMSEDLKIDKYLEDSGVTGAMEFMMRPSIKDIEFAEGDIIIVSNLDRFTRDTRHCLNDIYHLKQLGIRLIIKDLGDVCNDNNTHAKLILNILAVFAETERMKVAERLGNARKEKRKIGGYAGGLVPFGFFVKGNGKKAVLREHELRDKAIGIMVERRDEGASFREIGEEIEYRFGWDCSYQTVRRLVQKAVA